VLCSELVALGEVPAELHFQVANGSAQFVQRSIRGVEVFRVRHRIPEVRPFARRIVGFKYFRCEPNRKKSKFE
jgi:hypothetical protein